jgi:hypothetical protein
MKDKEEMEEEEVKVPIKTKSEYPSSYTSNKEKIRE